MNNIQPAYCSFEVSKLLKERGFQTNCYQCYTKDGADQKLEELWIQGCEGGMSLEDWCVNYNLKDFNLISKPTHALAIEWIRVNFGIWIYVSEDEGIYKRKNESWGWTINKTKSYDCGFNSPQEATEAALIYTLQTLIP